jgi:hypothetical protein
MKRPRTDYTLEFRQEAVQLVSCGHVKRLHSTLCYVSPMTFEAHHEVERKKSGEEERNAA